MKCLKESDMKTFALLACLLITTQASPSAAQDQVPAQSAPCQVQPQNGNGQQPKSNDLSGTLDPCDGVLQPPPTGDQGVITPPDEGKTPVIKPGEVPAQPPRQ